MLSCSELAVLTCAMTSNVLVQTPDVCELETLPSSAYCCPTVHVVQSLAVASVPTSIVRLVALAKCGSKYTTVSLGAVSLANLLTSTSSDSTPSLHCDCQRVTSSLLLALACQK